MKSGSIDVLNQSGASCTPSPSTASCWGRGLHRRQEIAERELATLAGIVARWIQTPTHRRVFRHDTANQFDMARVEAGATPACADLFRGTFELWLADRIAH